MPQAVVTVAQLSKEGVGIAFYEDKELYIPATLVGEELKVAINDEPFAPRSKRYGAKVIEIIKPSLLRTSHYECPHYGSCGGCQIMHLSYEGQLAYKQEQITLALRQALSAALPATLSKATLLKAAPPAKNKAKATTRATAKALAKNAATTGAKATAKDAAAATAVTATAAAIESQIASCLQPLVPSRERPCRNKSIRYFAPVCTSSSAALGAHDVEAGKAKDSSALDSATVASSTGAGTTGASHTVAKATGETVRATLGFYGARSHEVHEIAACPLEPESFGRVSMSLLKLINKLHLTIYDELTVAKTKVIPEAALRALLLREGDSGSISATLLTTSKLPEVVEQELSTWAAQEQLSNLYVVTNRQLGNALYDSHGSSYLLYGAPFITAHILEHSFALYPQTFVQVHYGICAQLYQQAIAHCCTPLSTSIPQVKQLQDSQSHTYQSPTCPTASSQPAASLAQAEVAQSGVVQTSLAHNELAQEEGVALDLCCGIGTMTLALAQHFTKVVGVEIMPESIAAAKANAVHNGLSARTHFIAAPLDEALPQVLREEKEIKAVIADPARVGLGPKSAKLLAKLPGPCQLSVIFCSLTALKRDLPVLLQGGFTLKAVQGFDMFPNSRHCETLVCLSKEN